MRLQPTSDLPVPAPDDPQGSADATDVVRPLPCVRTDVELVEGLRAGEPWARAALFDRFAPPVERIIRRLMGCDADVDRADLVHDAFVSALGSMDNLRDGQALLAWMQVIASRTAFRAIRARRAGRWLRFWQPRELPDVAVAGADHEVREAGRRAYAILDRLPAAERVAFGLRYIEGMRLVCVAEACEVSLATIKRRLARARTRFMRMARREAALRHWLEEGGQWPT